MNNLEKAREKINLADKKMAELFEERMLAVKEVALFKAEHGLDVFDRAREEQVIEKNTEYIKNDEIRGYYLNFIRNTMKQSRNYQHYLMSGTTVAYSGVEGAFAHIAAKKIMPDGKTVACPDFKSAYDAVVSGEADLCVLPVENSFAGEVGQVIDIAFSGPLFINRIYELSVVQNLLGVKGASIAGIEKVISHSQALMQCGDYIKKHSFEMEEAENTAIAAQYVAKCNNPKLAAIASEETAENYGLEILEKNINSSNTNTTRFAVFSRVNSFENTNRKILMFTVKNEAGSLSNAIATIAKYGYNMTSLRSRPVKDGMWEYYFYAEIEGDFGNENAEPMIKELSNICSKVKVAGAYLSTDK